MSLGKKYARAEKSPSVGEKSARVGGFCFLTIVGPLLSFVGRPGLGTRLGTKDDVVVLAELLARGDEVGAALLIGTSKPLFEPPPIDRGLANLVMRCTHLGRS